jgi:transposase-like protein
VIFVLVVTQWYGECIGVPHPLVINLIMDGEDILDNFSDKEEIDAGVAAPHWRKVLFYTLEKKRQIVNEAFSAPPMVRPTARKWSVQPTQICKWRQQMQQDAVLLAYPYPRTVEERTILKTHKLVKTRNEGRPTMTPNDLLQQLLPYIEGLRERGNAVSTTTVTLELLRMAPNHLEGSLRRKNSSGLWDASL